MELTAEFDGDGPGHSTTVNDSQGGAWYIPFPGLEEAADHHAFAGADLRVLVAQITTAGQLSGQMQVQIFREGLQYREYGGEVSSRLENDHDSVRFTGQRGEMWFLNTRRTLHRAGIPGDSLQRDILGLKFTPHAGDRDIWDETPAPEEKDLNWQSF